VEEQVRLDPLLTRRCPTGSHVGFLVFGALPPSYTRLAIELAETGREIEPGSIFGEIALFSPDRRRTHTARCVEDCTVLSIDESTVKPLFHQNPAFGFHLIGLVAARLSDDVERVTGQLSQTHV
jgi:CRP-like cAMP-binding protein